MTMKFFRAFALSAALLTASACTTTGELQLPSMSQEVNTLADATLAATAATRLVDVYVNTGNPNRATLLELQKLNDGVHSALTDLQRANAAGQSIAMASFNAARDAFLAYYAKAAR